MTIDLPDTQANSEELAPVKIDLTKITPEQISEVVELAWCDKTSFDTIESETGLLEKEVIAIMRSHMKPSSFRLWRKRVSGRMAKHNVKSRHDNHDKHSEEDI
jgi:uncharacterized protein (TIGR03643 family)